MKPIFLIFFLTLAATWTAAAATTDRSYYVPDLSAPQRLDVYNDGHNTFLQSVPGLVVMEATADGDRYIVTGVPQQIRGFMNGKPITVMRGLAPASQPSSDAAEINAEIQRIREEIASLSKASNAEPIALVPPYTKVAGKAVASSPAMVPAKTQPVVGVPVSAEIAKKDVAFTPAVVPAKTQPVVGVPVSTEIAKKDVASTPAVVPAKTQPVVGVPVSTEVARINVANAQVVVQPQWTMEKGQPIHIALEKWSKNAGWTFLWYPTVSWKSISNVEIKDKKDVVAAISEVVSILRDEGKPIQLRVSEGNNVMEVLSTEVKND
jgi:hypothetical protein